VWLFFELKWNPKTWNCRPKRETVGPASDAQQVKSSELWRPQIYLPALRKVSEDYENMTAKTNLS